MEAIYPDLKGRTAFVTGASSGIGRGIAEALLRQGMRVAGQVRSGTVPKGCVEIRAELGTEEGCIAAARDARDGLAKVDVFVHSAGIWNAGPIASIQSGTLEEMFRVNTFSAFYLMRELLPALRPRGSVVFIGSTAGQRGEAGHAHYAASKGALQSLVASLAVELAPEVRTNLVSPGWVRTPMAEEALKVIGPKLFPTIPNRRVAEIADVVNATLYLASDASSHLVEQDMCVSGGALFVLPRGQLEVVR